MGYRTLGPEQLDNNKTAKYEGFFRGVLLTPPAYGEEKLGPCIRLFVLTFDGRLIHDVARPGNQYLTTVVPPVHALIDVVGRKSRYVTNWMVDTDRQFDKEAYEKALSQCQGFDGSAPLSDIWGGEAIDVEPNTLANIRAEGIAIWYDKLVAAKVMPQLKVGETPPRAMLGR